MPSTSVSSSTIPTRSPATSLERRRAARAPSRSTCCRADRGPRSPRAAARRRRPSRRTGRSGRGSTRTRSARSARRARRWASRRRRRTARRAGGSSRRCPSRARAVRTRRRPRPRNHRSTRPATRLGSRGLRVAPNAEFSVDEPIANSSRFVLPIGMPPASSTRCTTVAVYGGSQPSRIRDEQVVGTPARAEVVLQRDRHAGERTGVLAPRDGRVDRVGRRAARRRPSRG